MLGTVGKRLDVSLKTLKCILFGAFHFGDFAHHFQVSVREYIPNSCVMFT